MRFTHVDEVLSDVQTVLGVPFTNLIFYRLASWPDHLLHIWQATRPVILTTRFQRSAAALAALAVPASTPSGFVWPPELTEADRRRARRLTLAYVAVQPQLLLLVTLWLNSLGGGIEGAVGPPRDPRREPGPGEPDADVPMVALPPVDPVVRHLFREMIDRRGHPGVASYYRSLAHWPTLLVACWRVLEPFLAASDHAARVAGLATAAGEATEALVGGLDLGADTDAVRALLTAWRDVQVPQLMLDTAFLHAAFADGAETTARNG